MERLFWIRLTAIEASLKSKCNNKLSLCFCLKTLAFCCFVLVALLFLLLVSETHFVISHFHTLNKFDQKSFENNTNFWEAVCLL